MGTTLISNLTDGQRQAVSQKMSNIVEINTPTYVEFKKSTKTRKFDEAGYRIRKIETMPGGHGFYSGASSGYNEPFPTQSASLWVYPVRYALPMQYDIALIESLKEGKSEFIVNLLDVLALHKEAAAKRMNQMCYGDGTESLAFSASTISSTGLQIQPAL